MNLQPQARTSLLAGSVFLMLAVLIGAFGAHGLKSIVSPEKLVTFETGVRYHFYHGFGLLFAGLLQQLIPSAKLKMTFFAFLVGILLFSFNCYFYALSEMKIFAMIVPLGGVMFVIGWVGMLLAVLKKSS